MKVCFSLQSQSFFYSLSLIEVYRPSLGKRNAFSVFVLKEYLVLFFPGLYLSTAQVALKRVD